MSIPATVEEFTDLFKHMRATDRAKSLAMLGKAMTLCWIPQPGPQIRAYDSRVDELLYGGAAGGGKTDLLIGLASTAHKRSLIFRRQAVDLDGIWERLVAVVGSEKQIDEQNSVKKRMTTTEGRLIEMGHLEKPNSEKSWQGRAHDLVGFDEAAQLDELKVEFVMRWIRSTEAGQHCRAVFATNPPIPDMRGGVMTDVATGDWLKRWFAPWIDPLYVDKAEPGEVRHCFMRATGQRMETIWVPGPGWYYQEDGEKFTGEPTDEEVTQLVLSKAKSRTFIKSRVADNSFLKGTGYFERLSATPEPLRSMLMDGAFGVKLADHEWQVIPTLWVVAAQRRWLDRGELVRTTPGVYHAPMRVLAADVAQGGLDQTITVPLYDDERYGQLDVLPGIKTPTGVEVVANLLRRREDQALIVLDGCGGWGGGTRDLLNVNHQIKAEMCISSQKSTSWTKDFAFKFLNVRAELWWAFREALDPDSDHEIMLPPSDALMAQLTAPHFGYRGNVIVIESKDDLRSRLNSSTDEADAVIMGWHYLKKAKHRLNHPDVVPVSQGGTNPGAQVDRRHRQADIDPLDGW